jgi:hypothetical protein
MKPETLPPAQMRVLKRLAETPTDDFDGELVASRGEAWVGNDRVSMRTVYGLLGLMVVRDASIGDDMQRYVISGTGRDLLAGYFTVDELRRAIHSGKPFMTGRRGITPLYETPSQVNSPEGS